MPSNADEQSSTYRAPLTQKDTYCVLALIGTFHNDKELFSSYASPIETFFCQEVPFSLSEQGGLSKWLRDQQFLRKFKKSVFPTLNTMRAYQECQGSANQSFMRHQSFSMATAHVVMLLDVDVLAMSVGAMVMPVVAVVVVLGNTISSTG